LGVEDKYSYAFIILLLPVTVISKNHTAQDCEESPVVQNTEMLNKPYLKGLVDNDCQEITAITYTGNRIFEVHGINLSSSPSSAILFTTEVLLLQLSSSNTVLRDQYSDPFFFSCNTYFEQL
jgi:hypothetical protein